MKKLMLAVLLCLALVGPAFADLPTSGMESRVIILDKTDITKLADDLLTDAYMNVLVELEAIKMFHTTSGFTPKQYDEYRNLLKYRLELLMEIHNRNIEIPQTMETGGSLK
jgi:hypothetical protein